MKLRTFVTGGAGFIGSCFVRRAVAEGQSVVCVDKLTYAANREAMPDSNTSHFRFIQSDINDRSAIRKALEAFQPHRIIHFAAESHVDRSIDSPLEFVNTNVTGTCNLLLAADKYWQSLNQEMRAAFRFLHVSTDEVYGSLGPTGKFSESTSYDPRSPYSASKAASDHFVRAWYHTYGLPIVITNCSNNYGPYQHREKLIPLMICNAIQRKPLPIYGDGMNVRDWLFVEDHCEALEMVLGAGRVGETYNIGGNCERNNREIVQTICQLVEERLPNLKHKCNDLISFVDDRPGHDRRYAIDTTKIENELGWRPNTVLEDGLRATVRWYADLLNAAGQEPI